MRTQFVCIGTAVALQDENYLFLFDLQNFPPDSVYEEELERHFDALGLFEALPTPFTQSRQSFLKSVSDRRSHGLAGLTSLDAG